jgi:8-oxo-dGTP diphosphatase
MTRRSYTPPTVTVDVALLRHVDRTLEVLAVHRARDPFAGQLALPGVYVNRDELVDAAARRAARDKGGVALGPNELTNVLTFDAVGRDPRGHALSLVHVGFVSNDVPTVSGETPQWVPLGASLAFDHAEIVDSVVTLVEDEWFDSPRRCAVVMRGMLGAPPWKTSLIVDVASAFARRSIDPSNLAAKLQRFGWSSHITDGGGTRGRPPRVWTPMESAAPG